MAVSIERDDLLGLAGGGNKTRKLEFLVAGALGQGDRVFDTAQIPAEAIVRGTGGT